MKRSIIVFLGIMFAFSILVVLAGCTLTIPPAVVDAVQAAITNKPPVVVSPTLTNTATVTPAPAVDVSGDLVDPIGYTEASVSANAQSEECSIEPHTGLLIRVPVYRPSVKGWWMLSSLIEGHVKLEGTRDNGTLVCETFTRDGMTVQCIGACDYEMHNGDTPETIRWTVKGNRVPYHHSRVYLVWVCHKAK